MKDLPSYLWCSNCSQSRNHTPTEKVKPCCQPCIYKENSFRFQKKKHCSIQEYLTVELEPTVKNKKQTQPSSIRTDNVLLSPVQAVEAINLSNEDCVSVSSVLSLSSETLGDLDSTFISSATSVASMSSGRELHSSISTGIMIICIYMYSTYMWYYATEWERIFADQLNKYTQYLLLGYVYMYGLIIRSE